VTPIERRAEELRREFPNALEPAPSRWQRALGVAVAVVLLVVAGIQTAGPESLGIPPVGGKWLGVIAFVFSGIQPFLPAVYRFAKGDDRG
jgi:hypothetical protein